MLGLILEFDLKVCLMYSQVSDLSKKRQLYYTFLENEQLSQSSPVIFISHQLQTQSMK